MRNISDETCRENQNTRFVFSNFSPKVVTLGDNVEKYGRFRGATDDNIIRCMGFACWIPKATGTHLECVIFIAFKRQQWLYERTPFLCYTYIFCLVIVLLWLGIKVFIGQVIHLPPSLLLKVDDINLYAKHPHVYKYTNMYFALL
jgi:hypothetical protein